MAGVEVGEQSGRIVSRAVLPERIRRADCLFRINTVRGPIVGQAALVEGLRGGRSPAAGLEVFARHMAAAVSSRGRGADKRAGLYPNCLWEHGSCLPRTSRVAGHVKS